MSGSDELRWEQEGNVPELGDDAGHDIDEASENVLRGWPESASEWAVEPEERAPTEDPEGGLVTEAEPSLDDPLAAESAGVAADESAPPAVESVEADDSLVPVPVETEAGEEPEAAVVDDDLHAPGVISTVTTEHAPGELEIPPGYPVLEGMPHGRNRSVGVVVSRFNGDVTSRLLARCLAELEEVGVDPENVTVMPVPGAFELPLAAIALAKTRRFSCVVALGCVIRGDTPHFEYVASEAASGLQLAALETGVPVSFGVLTLERLEQAEPRIEKGAETARSALEMADLFAGLRAAASR